MLPSQGRDTGPNPVGATLKPQGRSCGFRHVRAPQATQFNLYTHVAVVACRADDEAVGGRGIDHGTSIPRGSGALAPALGRLLLPRSGFMHRDGRPERGNRSGRDRTGDLGQRSRMRGPQRRDPERFKNDISSDKAVRVARAADNTVQGLAGQYYSDQRLDAVAQALFAETAAFERMMSSGSDSGLRDAWRRASLETAARCSRLPGYGG